MIRYDGESRFSIEEQDEGEFVLYEDAKEMFDLLSKIGDNMNHSDRYFGDVQSLLWKFGKGER